MEQGAAHEMIKIDLFGAEALMMPITKECDLDGMGISTCFDVMSKSFHFLIFLRFGDILDKMIKLEIDLHKNILLPCVLFIVCAKGRRIIYIIIC